MQHLILLGLPTVSGLVPSVLGNLASSQHRWSVSTRLFGFRQKDQSCHIITWVWHSLTYYIHTHTITCGYMLFSGILVRGAWWQNYIYIIDEGSWRLTDNRQSIHWAKLCRLRGMMVTVQNGSFHHVERVLLAAAGLYGFAAALMPRWGSRLGRSWRVICMPPNKHQESNRRPGSKSVIQRSRAGNLKAFLYIQMRKIQASKAKSIKWHATLLGNRIPHNYEVNLNSTFNACGNLDMFVIQSGLTDLWQECAFWLVPCFTTEDRVTVSGSLGFEASLYARARSYQCCRWMDSLLASVFAYVCDTVESTASSL